MIRTIRVGLWPTSFMVLMSPQDPARPGGWIQMTQPGQTRTIYLGLEQLPVDQEAFESLGADVLLGWWEGAR